MQIDTVKNNDTNSHDSIYLSAQILARISDKHRYHIE